MRFERGFLFFCVVSHWFFVSGQNHQDCIAWVIKYLTSICPTCADDSQQQNEPIYDDSISLRSDLLANDDTSEMVHDTNSDITPLQVLFDSINPKRAPVLRQNLPLFTVPAMFGFPSFDIPIPRFPANTIGAPLGSQMYNGRPGQSYGSIKREIDNHPNWKYFDKDNCGENVLDRLIGGTNAQLGQYPWLGVIGYKNRRYLIKDEIKFSCGAALINTCWVISAAHCAKGLPPGYYIEAIRLGEYDLNSDTDCNNNECAAPVQNFKPAKIIVHENYDNPKLLNDISLIKLSNPAQITRWVSPICLPHSDLLIKDLRNQYAEIAGWGIKNIKTRETSNILQTVKLPIIDIDYCKRAYRQLNSLDDSQICGGGIKGVDSCNGDSGGPLMKVDTANARDTPKYYAIGIVSFGEEECALRPFPAIYTAVSKYMKWILDNVSQC